MSDSSKDTILFAGIDLSLTGTGVVIIDENGDLKHQKLIKSKKNGDTPTEELIRIRGIRDEVDKEIIALGKRPSLAAIEGPAFMVRNATALVQLGALSYMVRESLFDQNIPFIIVAPTSLKKYLTGKGTCDKNIMLMETFKRYDLSFFDDNLCDGHALAQVAMSFATKKENLPQFQQEVVGLLKKQLWEEKK